MQEATSRTATKEMAQRSSTFSLNNLFAPGNGVIEFKNCSAPVQLFYSGELHCTQDRPARPHFRLTKEALSEITPRQL
jgi:hypothetical protein